MKKSNLLLLVALAGVLFMTSCKKEDPDPAPATPAGNTDYGTFTIDQEVQTPTILNKNVFESNAILTQVIAQNAKYQLKLEFNKKPLIDGEYTVENSPTEGMTVFITVMDMVTKDVDLISKDANKVTVAGNNITFSGIKGSLNDKDITLSANLMFK